MESFLYMDIGRSLTVEDTPTYTLSCDDLFIEIIVINLNLCKCIPLSAV